MKVSNENHVNFEYQVLPESPFIQITTLSNTVSPTIIRKALKVIMSVDKEHVFNYDIIKFTVLIINISSRVVKNIRIKEYITKELIYINNSMIVEGCVIRGIESEDEIYLGDLGVKSKIVINYKAFVYKEQSKKTITNMEANQYYLDKKKDDNEGEFIENSCIVSYNYQVEINKPPVSIPIKSNDAVIICDTIISKVTCIQNNIFLPHVSLNTQILQVEVQIEIKNTKIIDDVTNYEACNLLCFGVLT